MQNTEKDLKCRERAVDNIRLNDLKEDSGVFFYFLLTQKRVRRVIDGPESRRLFDFPT
ncbi:hypothetical protein J6590_066326 [Homalodisca vitripennis]|nr:hypothetical protein J6590_066326 [Homalodisca vitripennis]